MLCTWFGWEQFSRFVLMPISQLYSYWQPALPSCLQSLPCFYKLSSLSKVCVAT